MNFAGGLKAIVNAVVILPDSVLERGSVVFDRKIVYVGEKSNIDGVDRIINARGMYLSAGFIDIHLHGILGADTMDGKFSSFERMSMALLQTGVTSFLAATVTAEPERLHRVLEAVRGSAGRVTGANLIGVYLEGPFINQKRAGAHDVSFIIPPDFGLIKDYVDVIKIVAYAPELDEGFEFTKRLSYCGIVPSMGHTNATFEEAMDAIENGVSHVTHLFNAMSPFHHRAPGVVGAALLSNVSCELIADNFHVDPHLYYLVYRLKGCDRILLVSDSVSATLMERGVFELGGEKLFSDGNTVRLADGRLAGSLLTLNRAFHNFWKNCSIPLQDVAKMLTLNPAKLLKISDSKGSIEVGKDADMVIFDEGFNVYHTIVSGKIKYSRKRGDTEW